MGASRTPGLLTWFLPGLAALAITLAGCGASTAKLPPRRAAEQRLERIDLVVASRELERLEPSLRGEIQASRKTWPLVENGLTGPIASGTLAAVSRASARAQTIVLPPNFQPESGALTGPASGLAGLMQDFRALGVRGWRLIRQAVQGAGTPAATRFLRENAGLYIDCVYDGHFYLGVIGKKLTKSYEKLGGEEAFGGALTLARVERIAAFYSPATFDLAHPPLSLSD